MVVQTYDAHNEDRIHSAFVMSAKITIELIMGITHHSLISINAHTHTMIQKKETGIKPIKTLIFISFETSVW